MLIQCMSNFYILLGFRSDIFHIYFTVIHTLGINHKQKIMIVNVTNQVVKLLTYPVIIANMRPQFNC